MKIEGVQPWHQQPEKGKQRAPEAVKSFGEPIDTPNKTIVGTIKRHFKESFKKGQVPTREDIDGFASSLHGLLEKDLIENIASLEKGGSRKRSQRVQERLPLAKELVLLDRKIKLIKKNIKDAEKSKDKVAKKATLKEEKEALFIHEQRRAVRIEGLGKHGEEILTLVKKTMSAQNQLPFVRVGVRKAVEATIAKRYDIEVEEPETETEPDAPSGRTPAHVKRLRALRQRRVGEVISQRDRQKPSREEAEKQARVLKVMEELASVFLALMMNKHRPVTAEIVGMYNGLSTQLEEEGGGTEAYVESLLMAAIPGKDVEHLTPVRYEKFLDTFIEDLSFCIDQAEAADIIGQRMLMALPGYVEGYMKKVKDPQLTTATRSALDRIRVLAHRMRSLPTTRTQ